MGFVVAAIVNESSAVLDRFVNWYSAQGAAAIWLFFDNPDHPDLPRFAAMKGVEVTACTADFWHGLGCKADARFTRRQNLALTHAYHRLQDGWLLNVDADELVYVTGGRIADWLAQQSGDRLRIASAEYVQGPGAAQMFRLPIARDLVNDIYGAEADLFRRRFGLVGHADGKSFHRAGQPGIRLRQHWAEDATGSELTGARLGAADGVYLLHFMAPDYAQWRAKVDWRLNSHGFPDPIKDRIRILQASPDPEAGFRQLFDLLHGVSADQIARLQAVDGLLQLTTEIPPLP